MLRIARTLFLLIIAILLAVAFGSCKTKYIPVERVRIDSTAVYRADSLTRILATRDTVIERDSVVLMVKGDSVVKEVWRWRDRVSVVRDTVRDGKVRAYTRVVRDTVSVPYEVEVVKEVEKPLSWWEKTLRGCGWVAIAAMVLTAAWLAVRGWLRRQVPRI